MTPLTKSRLVIPAGFSKVTVHMTGTNYLHPPSWGFGVDSDVVEDVTAGVLAALTDTPDGYFDRLYSQYSVDRITARSDSETAELPVMLPGSGVSADLVTPAVCALVKLATSTAGRRGSGRWYWPGVLGETDVQNSGEIDSLAIASITDVAGNFIASLAGAPGLGLVLLHSYSWAYGDPDPGPPVGFPAPSPVTAATCQRFVATQRRRQR